MQTSNYFIHNIIKGVGWKKKGEPANELIYEYTLLSNINCINHLYKPKKLQNN